MELHKTGGGGGSGRIASVLQDVPKGGTKGKPGGAKRKIPLLPRYAFAEGEERMILMCFVLPALSLSTISNFEQQ